MRSVDESSRDIGVVGPGTGDGAAAVSSPANVCNDLAREPAEYFPNHLLDPVPCPALPRRGALLAGLVLFCLAMQLWMASRWHVIWPDTVDYLRVSRALDSGDPKPLAEQFGPNLYPLILVLLHRAGLDWLWAGQCWSIAVTCLAVLPLFGWLRRQFDDQVALVGCLLYALHPKLMIAWPLIIRDPTFWFLLISDAVLGLAGGPGIETLAVSARRASPGPWPSTPARKACSWRRRWACGGCCRWPAAAGLSAAACPGRAAGGGHAPGLDPADERHVAARLSALGAGPPRPRGNARGSRRRRSTAASRRPNRLAADPLAAPRYREEVGRAASSRRSPMLTDSSCSWGCGSGGASFSAATNWRCSPFTCCCGSLIGVRLAAGHGERRPLLSPQRDRDDRMRRLGAAGDRPVAGPAGPRHAWHGARRGARRWCAACWPPSS